MGPPELATHYADVERLAGIGSWRRDPGAGVLWWSPGMYDILGLSANDFDGSQSALVHAAVEEDRAIVTEAARRYEETGVAELLEYRIARPDGAIRHIWAYAETVDSGDGPVARGYVLDVTDRVRVEATLRFERDQIARASDETFRAFIRMTPLPALLHAEDGAILEVNHLWTDATGYGRDDLRSIDDWIERAYPRDGDRIRAGIRDLFDLEAPVDEGEFEIRTAAGETRQWLFSSALVGTLSDGRRAVVSVARDVTEERRVERERREYDARLYHAQKVESLGVLAGGIAHDFNNLLTGVLGNLAVALEEVAPDSEIHRLLHDARDAAEQAAALSRDMLTYAGKQEPERRAVCLDERVREMSGLLRASVSRRLGLEFEHGAGDAAALLGANQLGQVVMNLVSNAAVAMEERRGVIRVRTGVEQLGRAALAQRYLGAGAGPGAFVYIDVEDQGVGMEPAVARRLFEPFFTTRTSGRGLGMAVIIGIARTAHGVVDVDSEVGRGTRVRLSFPRVDAPPRRATERVAAAPVSPVPGTRSGAVLVVDDEKIVRRSVRTMLVRLGYDVVLAAGGDEAIAQVERGDRPLVAAIVDLTMPDRSGVDVLRALKERDATLPVILATGYSASAIPEVAAAGRHDGFLSKPFDIDTLRDTLRTVLG